jgi:ATP-dependent Clp protease protease subunit
MFGGEQPAPRQPSSVDARPVTPAHVQPRAVVTTPKKIEMPDIDIQEMIDTNWEAVQTALPSRTIVLREEITGDTANRVIGHLLLLERLSRDPIMLVLHSPGGQAYAGLAIHDVLRQLSVRLITVAETTCAGSALLLLLAGHKRYAVAGTEITSTTLTTSAQGQPSDLVIHSREIQRLQGLYNAIVQRHLSSIQSQGWDLSAVHLFSQQEALDYKLIDAVVERIEEIER